MAAVGGDEMVALLDSVFDTNGDGLLARGQVTETSDLLLLVEPIGGHFHASHRYHVVVHLLQLGLGRIECV